MSAAADAIYDIMQSLNIEKSAVLGHSLGGKVAMKLALNHNENITHLIVADIAPVSYDHSHQAVFDGLNSVSLDTIESRKDAEKQMAAHETQWWF